MWTVYLIGHLLCGILAFAMALSPEQVMNGPRSKTIGAAIVALVGGPFMLLIMLFNWIRAS